MEWQVVVALIIAIPVILFPAAFVWYLNVSGVYAVMKDLAKKQFKKQLRRVRATE